MKIWVTKYALTEGIQEMDAEDSNPEYPGMVRVRPKGETGYHQYFHGEGGQWHRSLDAAKVKAESMRQAKIKSLQKSIKRLEQLTF